MEQPLIDNLSSHIIQIEQPFKYCLIFVKFIMWNLKNQKSLCTVNMFVINEKFEQT